MALRNLSLNHVHAPGFRPDLLTSLAGLVEWLEFVLARLRSILLRKALNNAFQIKIRITQLATFVLLFIFYMLYIFYMTCSWENES